MISPHHFHPTKGDPRILIGNIWSNSMKQLVAIVCMMFAVFAFGAEKKPESKKTSITESELRTMAKAKPNAKDASTLYQVGMETNNVERKQEFFKASAACLLACGKYETYKKYVKGKLANAKAFEDSLKDMKTERLF